MLLAQHLLVHISVKDLKQHAFIIVFYLAAFNCTYGDLRLVDGAASFEGRVEICINNQWGTVCDDLWGSKDVMVACTQLGFLSQG